MDSPAKTSLSCDSCQDSLTPNGVKGTAGSPINKPQFLALQRAVKNWENKVLGAKECIGVLRVFTFHLSIVGSCAQGTQYPHKNPFTWVQDRRPKLHVRTYFC